MQSSERFIHFLNTWIVRLALAGAVLVVVQAIWISYGVFVRYALGKPDGTVTEATALLLVPVAFVGLAYALKEDAYPRVTLIQDILPQRARQWLQVFNLLIMVIVGGFLSIATVSAFLRALNSGASSEILLWPRFYFWFPVAFSLLLFTLYAFLKLLQAVLQARHPVTDTVTDQEAS